MQIPKKHLLTK